MATQTAAGAGVPDPAPAAPRTLPADRWLPGLGHYDYRFLHWVPAGTRALPGGEEHYRAPCGAECLRMPIGPADTPYEYESLPHHEDCQPGVERED